MKTICTAFIFHKNKLLIVFHKKKQCWMHVGGHMEEGETFSECLLREIKEETNLDVSIMDFSQISVQMQAPLKAEPMPFRIHSGTLQKSGDRKLILDYVCTCKDISVLRLQESELSDYRWIDISELEKYDMPSVLRELAREAWKKI